jgi:integrase
MFRSRLTPLHEWFPGWSLPRLIAAFPKVATAAGLVNVTFHTLRHTFASHAVRAGVDLLTLARLLGHKDVKHTQRYAHLAPDYLRQASTLAAQAIFAMNMPPEVPHDASTAA